MNIRNQRKRPGNSLRKPTRLAKRVLLFGFLIPFLLIAAGIWGIERTISRPNEALGTSRRYLESRFPGSQWEVGKVISIGEGLSKKWRLEFRREQPDGRPIQANLLVDRWQPDQIVGKFVVRLNPTEILEAGWDYPKGWAKIASQISIFTFLVSTLGILACQSFWLYWILRRGLFRWWDGGILILGGALLFNLVVLEVRPAFLAAYAVILATLFYGVGVLEGERNVEKDRQ